MLMMNSEIDFISLGIYIIVLYLIYKILSISVSSIFILIVGFVFGIYIATKYNHYIKMVVSF